MNKIQVVCPEVRRLKCPMVMSSWDVKFFLIFSFFFHYLLPSACKVFFIEKHSFWLEWSQVSVYGHSELLQRVTHKIDYGFENTSPAEHLVLDEVPFGYSERNRPSLRGSVSLGPALVGAVRVSDRNCVSGHKLRLLLQQRCSPSPGSPGSGSVIAMNSCLVPVTAALQPPKSCSIPQSAESCRGATTAFMPLLLI